MDALILVTMALLRAGNVTCYIFICRMYIENLLLFIKQMRLFLPPMNGHVSFVEQRGWEKQLIFFFKLEQTGFLQDISPVFCFVFFFFII